MILKCFFTFPDIDVPISQEAQGADTLSSVDPSKVDTLISFGFQEEIARKALKASVSILSLSFSLREKAEYI